MPFDGYQPEQPKLEEWQRVLLRAADIIEHRGWTQGDMENRRGYCAAGAILMGLFGRMHMNTIDETERFHAVCRKTGFYHPTQLAQWNDRDRRTSQEVVDMLRASALDFDYRAPQDQHGFQMHFMSSPAGALASPGLSGKKAKYLWIDDLNGPVSSYQADAIKYVMQSMLVLPTKVVSNQYAWV